MTSNARTFNPPGSIYSTEADKIESWALDHIGKAALTVIQYEADWNVDIEKDDESQTVDIDNDEDGSVEVESVHDGRSGSVVSQAVPGSSRRGPRIGYKKGAGVGVAESVEPDGRLPGAKDGLGAFPPCSDWARTMLKLKLKGAVVCLMRSYCTAHREQENAIVRRKRDCALRKRDPLFCRKEAWTTQRVSMATSSSVCSAC